MPDGTRDGTAKHQPGIPAPRSKSATRPLHVAVRSLMAGFVGFTDIVFLFPLVTVIAAWFLNGQLATPWLLMMCLLPVLGAFVTGATFGRRISLWVTIVIGILVAGAFAQIAVTRWSDFGIVVCTLVGMFSALFGGIHWRNDVRLPSVPLGLFGLAIHFICFFFFIYVPWLNPWIPGITASAVLSLCIVLMSQNIVNLDSLLSESELDKGLPRSVVGYNRFAAGLFTGVICLIFLVGLAIFGLTRAVAVALPNFNQGLQSLARSGHLQNPFSKHGKPPKKLQPPPEPSTLLKIIEYGILILLGLVMLFVIIRLIRRLIPLIWRWIQSWSTAVDDAEHDYVDEEEHIADEAERWVIHRQRRRRLREHDYAALRTPGERIRYLYRAVVRNAERSGYRWRPTDTAAETMMRVTAPEGAGGEASRGTIRGGASEGRPRGGASEGTAHGWASGGTAHRGATSEGGDTDAYTDEALRHTLTTLYDEARYGTGDIPTEKVDTLKTQVDALKFRPPVEE